MALGSFVNGNGTITTYTTNGNIFGSSSTFLLDLKPGAVIANVSNVFIGYVAYVYSNTSLALRANANLALSSASYHYAPYIANVPNVTYNCIGNINSNTTTNIVFGNNTAFISNLSYGDVILIPNSQANVDSYVGKVEMVIDNNTVLLSTNAYANISDSIFYKQSPVYYNTSQFGSSYAELSVNSKLNQLNGNLYSWASSGLIPGVSFVHKYHPPLRDNVTGILVDLPSATFTNVTQPPIFYNLNEFRNSANVNVSIFSNANTLNSYSSSLSTDKIGQTFVISDFDKEYRPFGTDVSYVHESLYNSDAVKFLASSDEYTFAVNKNAIVPNSHVSRFANSINANINRITDTLTSTVEYFGKNGQLNKLKENVNNLGQNQDLNLRLPPINLKKISASGAPIAIPGILNVKVESDEPPADTTYKPPVFKVIKGN